ncbi:hypothetical protein AB0C90_06265 [Streptomyces sp. NPDC048550]|uniref:hypothetical protein n=1 Tax=Streptomyces sp. NPDC048550 TaxID=3155739 RepID=UPI0034480935
MERQHTETGAGLLARIERAVGTGDATHRAGSGSGSGWTRLDTTGPYTGDLALRAAATRDVYAGLLAQGTYATDPGLAALIAEAVADPAAPSPAPWPPNPSLRFTRAGLAHFALIRTAALPGPANWIYAQGHSAGEYAFGATPAEDRFTLAHTSLATWRAATAALGSGLIPTALMRDLAAVWAGDEATYRIPWDRIRPRWCGSTPRWAAATTRAART